MLMGDPERFSNWSVLQGCDACFGREGGGTDGMEDEVRTLWSAAKQAIEGAGDTDELERTRVEYLGRKGKLATLRRGLGKLPADERPTIGRLVNEAIADVETALDRDTSHPRASAAVEGHDPEHDRVRAAAEQAHAPGQVGPAVGARRERDAVASGGSSNVVRQLVVVRGGEHVRARHTVGA